MALECRKLKNSLRVNASGLPTTRTKHGDAGPSAARSRRFAKVLYRLATDANGQRTIPVISASLRRLMPLQERACAVDGASLQIRRILPGKHRDLGVRRQ